MTPTVLALLLALAGSGVAVSRDEVIMPIERYTTDKGRALATEHRARLVELHDGIYECMPWVGLQPNGIGFRTPKGSTADDRYLSMWVVIHQKDDDAFAQLGPVRRASAMFSRYGVDLIRRMATVPPIVSDPRVEGFGVVLSWLKPGSDRPGLQPATETLVLFVRKDDTLAFLGGRLAPAGFAGVARVSMFDGTDERDRPALEIWEDRFVREFRLPGHKPAAGQHC